MSADTRTPQLFAADLAGEVPSKPTKKELAAARVARFRERHGLRAVTVNLPASAVAELDAMLAVTGETRSQLIERTVLNQGMVMKLESQGLAVVLPVEVRDEFAAWVAAKGKGRTASQVIEKLIRTQLLRPR